MRVSIGASRTDCLHLPIRGPASDHLFAQIGLVPVVLVREQQTSPLQGIGGDDLLDLGICDIAAVLEQPVQDEPLAVFAGRFALEIDQHRAVAMDLAIGFRRAVSDDSNRPHQPDAQLSTASGATNAACSSAMM